MRIQEQDLYHGAALTQIVEHPSFKALNKASAKYGHYLINTDRHVFVKYRKNSKSPWQHTLSQDELRAIATELIARHKVYLCLVCGNETVCALNADEIQQLIDLNSNKQQWIKIEAPPRKSCRISGSIGRLQRTVPHNSFPDKVFCNRSQPGQ
jgi:hypothetical protein